MKRTVCFALACALGLTLTVSAQNMNSRDLGNRTAEWTGENTVAIITNTLESSPNPFTSSTIIAYTLDTPGFVRLNVYDTAGCLISALVDEYQDAGRHSVIWNAADLESGTFVCALNCGDNMYTHRITLLK